MRRLCRAVKSVKLQKKFSWTSPLVRVIQQVQKTAKKHTWVPPKPGEFKTNFDGAMFNESDEAGIGIVVENSFGQVMAAMAQKVQKPRSVEVLELVAARRAVNFVHEIGQQSHFEGDSEIGIKALCKGDMLQSSFGHLVRDTLLFVSSLRSFSFSHIVR